MAEKNKKTNTGLFSDKELFSSDVKAVNTKGIDDYISKLQKPTGGNVYDLLAARYRSQGEGEVLRTQKDIASLFGPTINLIQEREAIAKARFALEKQSLPDFDDSVIFGELTNTKMPVTDEIMNISKRTKENMRLISRLNPADDRYDDLRRNIEKDKETIAQFDIINKKLLEIRNNRTDDSQWSNGMDAKTTKMWRDLENSNGANIKIRNGILSWVDPETNEAIDLSKITSPVMKNNAAVNLDIQIRGKVEEYIQKGGTINNNAYKFAILPLFSALDNAGPNGIKSLIFDGLNADDIYSGINTNSFLEQVIKNHYGKNLTPEKIQDYINLMKSQDVTAKYIDADGNSKTLMSLFKNWYKGRMDEIIENAELSALQYNEKNKTNVPVMLRKNPDTELKEKENKELNNLFTIDNILADNTSNDANDIMYVKGKKGKFLPIRKDKKLLD